VRFDLQKKVFDFLLRVLEGNSSVVLLSGALGEPCYLNLSFGAGITVRWWVR